MDTSDLIAKLNREHAADRRMRDEAHEQSTDMVKSMCNAGLVDDIEPDDGVIVPLAPWACIGCGQRVDAEDVPGPCDVCGANKWRMT